MYTNNSFNIDHTKHKHKKKHYRGGDCHQAFLPHRECVCYDRCPRCCVELELDVNFDKVNQTRPDQEKDLPLTVTSRDLVSHTYRLMYVACLHHIFISII